MKNWPNRYVLANALLLSNSAFLTGYVLGSFSGVLEMPGFKQHFTSLYGTNQTYETYSVMEDNQTLLDSTVNVSSGAFCDSPDSTEASTACGLGSGTDSASFIGLIVAIASLGSLVGCLMGGWISDWISRKYSLMMSLTVFFVGATITASAFNNHEWMLLLGRFLCGYAIGVFYVVMPVYLSEISPKESRGIIVSIVGPLYALGLLVSGCTNIGFAEFYVGWRVSIGLLAVATLVSVFGSKFLPHSPRWLVKKGRYQESLLVLSKINHNSKRETFVNTYLELEYLKDSIKTDQNLVQTGKEVFKCRHMYRLFLLVVLFFLNAWATPFISYYSPTFFCEANVSPFLGFLAVTVVYLISSIATTFLVDKIGRKMMFLTFLSLNLVAVLGVAFLTQFCASNSVVAYLVVILLCLYAFGFTSSWLTLPWVINGEVFPISIRGLAAGIASGCYWFSIFCANLVTPIILQSLKTYGLMYLTAGVNLFAFFFILVLIPETKGVCLEDMDKIFSRRNQCHMKCIRTSSTCDDPSFKYDPEDDKLSLKNEPQDRKPSLKICEDDFDGTSLKYDCEQNKLDT